MVRHEVGSANLYLRHHNLIVAQCYAGANTWQSFINIGYYTGLPCGKELLW